MLSLKLQEMEHNLCSISTFLEIAAAFDSPSFREWRSEYVIPVK